MPNPKEIAQKRFEKALGFGYRMDDVEEYLEKVAEEMQDLLDEKADLEKKLEILADKLTEYRDDEESLRTAILSAQKLGDSVIRESKTKAEIIMRDATIKAEAMVSNARRQIERENESLVIIQKEVANFKNHLMGIYKQHLELINSLPGDLNDEELKKRASAKVDYSPASSPAPVSSANEAESREDEEEEVLSTETMEAPTIEFSASKEEKIPDVKGSSSLTEDEKMVFNKESDSRPYTEPDLKRFSVSMEDDKEERPSSSLKNAFSDEDLDSDELDLSFFNKANTKINEKPEREMRFGESFKIKRDSSFPRFK